MSTNQHGVDTKVVASQDLIDAAQKLDFAVALIEQIRGGAALRTPADRLKEMIDALIRGVPWMGYNLTHPFSVFRGRIENDVNSFKEASEFSYKPLRFATDFGRCHRPGTTIFYGASNLDTVLSELTPEIGDRLHVGVATIDSSAGLATTAIGEIDHWRRHQRAILGNDETVKLFEAEFSNVSDPQKARILLIDAFFADIFSQPAAKPRDRKATSLLTELVLEASVKDDARSVECLAYPSVAHRGGMNFAIPPDKFDVKLKWEQFMIFEITDYLGFGLYGRKQLASAQGTQDDSINWKPIQS